MPMNTANKLTLARVFMIPLFLVIVYWVLDVYKRQQRGGPGG